jgi:cytochrome o ubiquinol oxidase subunit II
MTDYVGAAQGVLDPHGPIAAQERQLLLEALATMSLVVVPVILLTLFFAWWFRASNARAIYRPTWSYSGRIEFSIWMIPMLVILFLGAITWTGAHDLDPFRPLDSSRKALRVSVVSLDWKWLFIYPELGIASVNELAAPVGTPVHLELTSATVMNSFFVPGIAGQIYTMPGMSTQLSLQASNPGLYRGLSAQFSGDGFAHMGFNFIAGDAASFQAWVDHARQSAATLSSHEYDRLAKQQATADVSYFSAVEAGVFTHALEQ